MSGAVRNCACAALPVCGRMLSWCRVAAMRLRRRPAALTRRASARAGVPQQAGPEVPVLDLRGLLLRDPHRLQLPGRAGAGVPGAVGRDRERAAGQRGPPRAAVRPPARPRRPALTCPPSRPGARCQCPAAASACRSQRARRMWRAAAECWRAAHPPTRPGRARAQVLPVPGARQQVQQLPREPGADPLQYPHPFAWYAGGDHAPLGPQPAECRCSQPATRMHLVPSMCHESHQHAPHARAGS